ncbi:hypothetical protein WMY93_004029 [Mugilogobius chulae]|uniref:Protein FAM81B n=1 Tax=Mugilogobius chulae TaxID=88201 RepID=A0AAW0PYR4_9GOBI
MFLLGLVRTTVAGGYYPNMHVIGWWGKPECPEETHPDTGRNMQIPHRKARARAGIEPATFLLPDAQEDRVSSGNKTLAVLLEQAFRIKEEVSSSLQKSERCAQAQAVSSTQLQNHILTITRIVQQLSDSIQPNSRARRVTCGTTQAVQWLDHKNVAGIGDLRGRVARCDASLAKLSAEVKSTERQVMRLQQEVTQLRSAVEVMIQEVHVKIVSKDNGVVKQSSTLQKWTEQQIVHCVQSFEQSHRQLQDNMQEVERRLLDRYHALESGQEQLKNHQEQCVCRQTEQLKQVETRLTNRMESLEKNFHHELQLLKHNYHKGFRSVHDAIEALREIANLKSRLEKGKIQK